jgi:SAM-dependent methyltransferase
MRGEPAGDFDYERFGQHYSAIRRPDPHIAAAVRRALGEADSLINVGAGAGSYEPDDIEVTAVEPSASMRSQRPPHRVAAIDAVAEDLPFPDDAFDAALASVTIHQWPDLDRGLAEVRRVTRGPVVILTFDPVSLGEFWLAEYAPELMACESARMPPIHRVVASLGGRASVDPIPLAADCTDGFAEAFFGRPEAFLDELVRRSQSAWGFIGPAVEERSVEVLRTALDDGSWDRRHGPLRTLADYRASLRLITAFPD